MTKCTDLLFVAATNSLEVLNTRLLASPCLQAGGLPVVLGWNQKSAAELFNAVLDSRPQEAWIVWVHQDVFLPEGWDGVFTQELDRLSSIFLSKEERRLGVVGLYGVRGTGQNIERAGCIRDRGNWLNEPTHLPSRVDSLDELLFAIPSDSPLRLDPKLGFDFYATDLVLQGQALGLESYVVYAPCEHWAETPQEGEFSEKLISRVLTSAKVFESKWKQRLPVVTPCFNVTHQGAVREIVRATLDRK